MFLIYFTFFVLQVSDAAFAQSTQTKVLWEKLNAYKNATGISAEKMISIWEKSQEFSKERSVKGKPLTVVSSF